MNFKYILLNNWENFNKLLQMIFLKLNILNINIYNIKMIKYNRYDWHKKFKQTNKRFNSIVIYNTINFYYFINNLQAITIKSNI